MAYSTGSGTLDQMITSAATFALANGWTAPAGGVTARYWRIVGEGNNTGGFSTYVSISNLVFRDSGGTTVGAPSTALASSEDGSFPASGAFSGGEWRSASNTGKEQWIGGDWGVAVEVEQVTLTFAVGDHVFIGAFALQYSSDAVTWTTLTTFNTRGLDGYGSSHTFIKSLLTWPLTPDGSTLVSIGTYDATNDDEVTGGISQGTEYFSVSGSAPINSTRAFLAVGSNIYSLDDSDRNAVDYLPAHNTVDEWHFFTESAVSTHLHVAFRMTHNSQDRWFHWSMGSVDTRGMTYNGITYAAVDGMRYYANTNDTGAGIRGEHNNLKEAYPFGTSGYGGDFSAINQTVMFQTPGANYPVLDDGNWPPRDVTFNGNYLAPSLLVRGGYPLTDNLQLTPNDNYPAQVGSLGWMAEVNPISGFLTLGTIPITLNSGQGLADQWVMLGEFPNIRTCRIDNLTATQEITVGVDTWMVFPRLFKQDEADLGTAYQPGSGPCGWAYKKV